VAAPELATQSTNSQTHLGFCLLCCCVAKATSSRSSACTFDRKSGSPELSSSSILHRERVTMVFGKRHTQLPDRFFMFVITIVYLFVRYMPTVVVYNTPSPRLSGIFLLQPSSRKRKHHMFSSHIMSFIMST
jgi:hypothetical protein